MAHLFLNTLHFNGDDRYQTESAILMTTPYSPRVLIVGTYNDGNNVGNQADFFFGRNFFWPIFENFSHNNHALVNRRVPPNWNQPGPPPNPPNIERILHLCGRFKLTFADLFQDIAVNLLNHDDAHLEQALINEHAITNEENIVRYINDTISIEYVYLTTSLAGLPTIQGLWNHVRLNCREGVSFGKILTPSGRGNIPAIPGVVNVVDKIARYWMWVNNAGNPNGVLNHPNYVHLNHQWLDQSGVNPLNF